MKAVSNTLDEVASPIQIRPCREEDVAAVRRFIDTHWRSGHALARDEALLRWQFDQARAETNALEGLSVLLAWEEERIVGMLGLIDFDFNVRGMIVPGVWLSHWLTIPESRAHGVGLKLLWAVHALRYEVIFVLGINDAARRVYSALRFELLERMPRWIGVIDVERTRRLLQATNPNTAVERLDDLCAQYRIDPRAQASANPNVNVVEWSETLAAGWDSFWAKLGPGLLGPSKDLAYLKWRYIDHPTFQYEIRLALHGSEILGLTVYRLEKIRDRDEKVLRVVEFLARPEAESPLASSLVQAAISHEAILADFYCTSERVGHPLERFGFRRQREGEDGGRFPARFQPLESRRSEISGAFWLSAALRRKLGLGPLLSSDDFYITKSDGDQDRPN